jgi:serine/threonine protein kinase
MAIDTAAKLVEELRASKLLESAQLRELDEGLAARFPDARSLAGELIRRGWLTPYQINQVMQGQARSLVLGGYRLLERLGAGGMGQVFKAKQIALNRIVAVKIIRREHLEKPDAIHRFFREMKAAAQLSHPNIVMALDADQIGDTHFFAMEYVDGLDLAQLVKQQGPLPVAVACEIIRQAALGLQHAFERNLVHRDIKPANLLLPRQAITDVRTGTISANLNVKILDMGLARLVHPTDEQVLSWQTQEGKVLGTPDYIAPEQALKSSAADIRADLYSLGCTLYYMLAGRVPFPGGNLMEKLLKHKMDHPTPLEELRGDVPPGVSAIVRKLMAKKPEERFQTPAELAAALIPYTNAVPVAAMPVGGEVYGAGEYDANVPLAQPCIVESGTPVPVAEPLTDTAELNSRVRFGRSGSISSVNFRRPGFRLERSHILLGAGILGGLLMVLFFLTLAGAFSRKPSKGGKSHDDAPVRRIVLA